MRTCFDCKDTTCPQFGADVEAPDDCYTSVEVREAEPVPTPQQIASCDCHASMELRLCVLEDLVSRMRREMAREVEL